MLLTSRTRPLRVPGRRVDTQTQTRQMQVWDLPTVRVWNVGVYAVRHLYPIKMPLNSDADLMYNFTSISTMERQKKN